jgi:hypothetical protein
MEHIYQQSRFGQNWFNCQSLYGEMVKKFPSGSHFVEVGSWKGKSSAFMCVEIINSEKQIKFDCVDTWKGSVEHANYQELPHLYDIFKENMKPFEGYYTDLKMKSIDAAKLYEDESLDFVFIDASHEYEDVKDDITHWILKVKKGGILSGDDYSGYWGGVIKAVNEILGEKNIKRNGDTWIYYKN